jgi:NAD(P)-dependent dehydrogenase (short-subunit alcohol dehydrogenase family)
MICDLRGRTAFITGGGSGIGAGIARVLAEQGAVVVVADIDVAAAETVAKGLGGDAMALRADVASSTEVADAVGQAEARFGVVDILVNNAGINAWNDDETVWRRMFEINVMGVVRCCDALVPGMKERGYGKIVNIASMAGHAGRRWGGAYATGKAAVLRYTKGLAYELASSTINVNAICPGAVWTPLQEDGSRRAQKDDIELEGKDPYEVFLERYEDVIPMGRPQSVEDVGKAVAFLVSDDAANITGQCLHVDGGAILRD